MKKIFLFLFSVIALSAWATTPDEVPNPHSLDTACFVVNLDGVLSADAAESINQVSQKLYNFYGGNPKVELVVVALQSIGWADVVDWGVELFNLWGIGDAETNTGVLIVLAENSRDFRIITGEGAEGLLTDAKCTSIFEDVKPLLADDNFDDGMLEAARLVARALTTDEAQAELLLGYHRKPASEQPWKGLSVCSIIGLLIWLLVWLSKPRCPSCRKRGSRCRNEILLNATTTSSGSGVRHYTCNHCNHEWDVMYTIPRKAAPSSSSGGGWGGSSGGFSGGSFGGGHSFGGGGGGKF